jgi:hypothetical protein
MRRPTPVDEFLEPLCREIPSRRQRPWRRFASDRGVVGQTITLNDRPTTIVGVLPRQLRFRIRFFARCTPGCVRAAGLRQEKLRSLPGGLGPPAPRCRDHGSAGTDGCNRETTACARSLSCQWRLACTAARPRRRGRTFLSASAAGSGGFRAADRLHQFGEPTASTRHCATEGNGGARRIGGRTLSAGQAVAYREHYPRHVRGTSGAVLRMVVLRGTALAGIGIVLGCGGALIY